MSYRDGWRQLVHQKNTILTAIEDDIKGMLSQAKSDIDSLTTKIQSAFDLVKPKLTQAINGQVGGIQVQEYTTALTPNTWLPVVVIAPGIGSQNTIQNIYFECSIPYAASRTTGFHLGTLGYVEPLGVPGTKSSMPDYIDINDANYGTAFSCPLSWQVNGSGKLVPALIRVVIPVLNATVGTNGLVLYAWNNAASGFTFVKAGVTYSSSETY